MKYVFAILIVNVFLIAVLIATPIQVWLSLIELPKAIMVTTSKGNLFSGDAMAELTVFNASKPTKLEWQWCPLAGVTTWCVDAEQSGLAVKGKLGIWSSMLVILNTELKIKREYEIPEIAEQIFDVDGNLIIKYLAVNFSNCDQGYIENVNMMALLKQVWILGVSVGELTLEGSGNLGKSTYVLSGDSLNGRLVLDKNSYTANAMVSPPTALHNAMALLLNAQADEQGVWNLSQNGGLAC